MVADVDIRNYYLDFIKDAFNDGNDYKNKYNECIKIKKELYKYINNNKNIILNAYNLDIDKYDIEWTNQSYNDKETLYNYIIKYIKLIEDTDANRIILLQIIKYCNLLRVECRYKELMLSSYKRKDITFKEYHKLVSRYYAEIHKTVLEGFGYKFNNHLGVYCCSLLKLANKNPILTVLDFNATNQKKKEILAKGLKLYNHLEAVWYKARNIPYDGIDCRVWKRDDTFYKFSFVRCNRIKSNASLDYDRNEYVNKRYRGLGYKKVADEFCKTIDDVYKLNTDIRYKLNVLLYKYPEKSLNFIRNAEQKEYDYRASYWKNRQ